MTKCKKNNRVERKLRAKVKQLADEINVLHKESETTSFKTTRPTLHGTVKCYSHVYIEHYMSPSTGNFFEVGVLPTYRQCLYCGYIPDMPVICGTQI